MLCGVGTGCGTEGLAVEETPVCSLITKDLLTYFGFLTMRKLRHKQVTVRGGVGENDSNGNLRVELEE